MSWYWKLPATIVQVFCAYAGITVLGHDDPWMNGALRGGIALFCFTNAIPDYFSVTKLLRVSNLRSLQLR
jgi:hypothetical protein